MAISPYIERNGCFNQGSADEASSVVHSDPNILRHAGVRGNPVPVQALIDHIEGGHSLNEFLDDFPTVTREIAIARWRRRKPI